jgi:hypothetical protein
MQLCPQCRRNSVWYADKRMCEDCLAHVTEAATQVLDMRPLDIPLKACGVCVNCGHLDECVTSALPFCLACIATLGTLYATLQDDLTYRRRNEFPYSEEPYGWIQTHTHNETGPCWCPCGIPLSEVLR